MGLQSKVSQFAGQIQQGAKNTLFGTFLFSLKLVTGLMIGLTLAFIGQEMMGFGMLAFTFIVIFAVAVVLRVTALWGLAGILIFDLICVLIALLLRMYILVAP